MTAQNLTGTWHGTYTYPFDWGMDTCAFIARLVETGELFFGSITETVSEDIAFLVDQRAYVEGRRNGNSVSFLKSYDGSGDWTHSVSYLGELCDDGHKITGVWTISEEGEIASGPFMMSRCARQAAEEVSVKEAIVT